MKTEGPDCTLAWCVAFAACFINFVTAGIGRMSGILFVAFIDIFDVSRGLAIAPFSIKSSTINLLGPVIGILAQHYGIRTVMVFGGIVGLFSTASCYFAKDFTWIIIASIGIACISSLPQVVIGQYFQKHITTAAGLSKSGACVGSFIFPTLIEFILNKYGMQGTFHIIAGISFHVIPAAMLLKKPPWLRQNAKTPSLYHAETKKNIKQESNGNTEIMKNKSSSLTDTNLVKRNSAKNTASPIRVSAQFNCFQNNRQMFPDIIFQAVKFLSCHPSYSSCIKRKYNPIAEYSLSDKELVLTFLDKMYHIALEKYDFEKRKSLDKTIQNIKSSEDLIDDAEKTFEALRKECLLKDFVVYLEAYHSEFVKSQTIPKILTAIFELIEVHELYEKILMRINSSIIVDICPKLNNDSHLYYQKEEEETEDSTKAPPPKQGFKEYVKTAMKLNSDPIFSLICICRALHFITFNPVVTAVVDFGMDKGFPVEYGKYIIAALSAGDLMGRLGVGWITDRGYVSLPKYMAITMVIQGATTISLPFMNMRWSVLTMVCVFGFLEGSIYVRHPVLIAKYIRSEDQPIAMGCLSFLTGLIGFGVPAYIDYFRDTLGAYNGVFYVTGAMGIVVGFSWLFEPQFVRCSTYRHEIDSK